MAAYLRIFPEDLSGYENDDPTVLDPYSDQVETIMAAYGGRYLRLRRQPMELLEGDWHPPLGMGMVEFPSMESARAFYHSAEYAPLRAWHNERGRFTLLLVDGMPEGMSARSYALARVEQAHRREQVS